MPISTKQQKVKLQSDPEKSMYVEGFAGGLNTLVSPQHIADNECSELLNAQITEDGVISRRLGSTQYDSSTDGARVFGLGAFTTYNSSGVATRYLLKMDNSGNLKSFNSSSKTWTTLTGYTYSTEINTEFVQGVSVPQGIGAALYILNGKDPLSRTEDASTITVFTAVSNPSGGLSISTQGTAGNQAYSYTYTCVTNYGETLPVTNVTISTGNATLTSSNYNQLTITRNSDSHITGYNVYGRSGGTSGINYFLAFIPQSASGNLTYNDTGADAENTSFSAPTSNTTAGKVMAFGEAYQDSLVGAGDPTSPSAVYFSAAGDFEDYQIVNGGGYQLVRPEDGDRITAIKFYKNEIVIWKNRSSFTMSLSTSNNLRAPTLTLVNPQIGCAAYRTAQIVLNDLFFISPYGSVFTLGYQQGYYGAGGVADLLRTNEVSIKIHPTLATINPDHISTACASYSPPNYKYVLAYADGTSTYNNKIVVYDSRYNAWGQWDNMNINCVLNYVDANNNEWVLYGDDNTGKVVALYDGNSDQGSAFTFRMRTKDFNGNAFHLIKTWIWPTIHFRNIFGTVTITMTADGTSTAYTNTITGTSNYTGWSYDLWASTRWGTTKGSSATATVADAPRMINLRTDSRSIMFLFENTSTSDSISILGVESRYLLRLQRRLPSQYIIS